jgi:hypothetical protein
MRPPTMIIKQILIYLTAIVLVFAAGWYCHDYYNHVFELVKFRRVAAKGFHLTSPLLDVEFPEGMGVNYEPLPFRGKVDEYVKKQIKSGQATQISVYYRDLLGGPWFGINENTEFDPASMMKVMIMVVWLKRAENNPQLLKKVLTYNYREDMRTMQSIKPLQSVIQGHSYTVNELLTYMMSYSDNNATRLLYESIKQEEINEVLSGMDVDYKMKNGENALTVHGFSGLFRILYNAAYLNREMSEKALKLLTFQDFPQGIVAGVPKGTVVASKFGEAENGPFKQLHEFGIVYHPKHRYLIGVMTRGTDYSQLAQVLQGISRIVYDEVDAGTFSPDDVSR